MVFSRTKKLKRRIAFFLLLLVCVWFWWVRYTDGTQSSVAVVKPTSSVSTDKSVCSVTVSMTGVESDSAIRLFISVCEGLDIRPCIFVTADWLEDHPELIPSLSFADLGLLFEESPERITKKRTMAEIAEQNERFMAMTGEFPRYVRLPEGASSSSVSSVLQSYGQISIGYSDTLSGAFAAGSIVDCGLLNGTTGYLLAKFCATAIAQEYEILSVSDLLGIGKA